MPHSRILVHLVWTTKKRYPYLTPDKRTVIQNHIMSNASRKGIYIIALNSHLDHTHCLVSLGNEQSVSEIVKLIKGESSYWINKHKLFSCKFSWQEEFYAISVSESGRKNVINYIRNQDEHHRGKTFKEEYDEFMEVIRKDLLG